MIYKDYKSILTLILQVSIIYTLIMKIIFIIKDGIK